MPLGLVVKNGSNRCARASATARARRRRPRRPPRLARRDDVTATRCPASIAFLIKLTITPWILWRVARAGSSGGAVHRHRRAAVGDQIRQQLARAGDHRGQVGRRALDARRARERQQRIDHVAQAGDLARHLRPQPRHPGLVGGVLGDELDRHPQAVERVLELVGDRRRGLAHRGEALGLDQRRLRRHQLLGPLAHPLLQQRRPPRAAPGRASGSTSPCARTRRRSAANLLGARGGGRSRPGPARRAPAGSRPPPAPAAAGEVGRQQSAPAIDAMTTPEQDPDQRRPLLLQVGGQRSPGPGEHNREVGRRRAPASTRTARSGRWPRAVSDAGAAAPAAAIASAQPDRSAAPRPVGRIDHLPVAVDQHRVGVARQVLVQRGRDQVVLAAARSPRPARRRTGRRATSGCTIFRVRPSPGSSVARNSGPGAPPAPTGTRARSPNAWPRNSDRSGTERTQVPSAASSSTAVL